MENLNLNYVPCSDFIKKIIKSLDFFNIYINFRVREKPIFKTVIGGFCTILLIFTITTFGVASTIEFFSNSEFNLRFFTDLDKENQFIIGKNNSFYFVVLITDSFDKSVLQTDVKDYFNVTLRYISKINGTKDHKIYPSKKCTEFGKTNNHAREFENLLYRNISEFYCFEADNLLIKGNYNFGEMKYLEIIVNFNKLDLIDTTYFLIEQGFKASIFFSDNDINIKQGLVNTAINSVYTYLDDYYYQTMNIFISNYIFERDTHILYKNYYKKQFTKYQSSESMFRARNFTKDNISNNTDLVRFIFRALSYKNVLSISYNKLPQLLSNIFAYSKSIFYLFNFLLASYKSFKAKQSIFFRVYKFKDLFNLKFSNFSHDLDAIINQNSKISEKLEKSENQKKLEENNIQEASRDTKIQYMTSTRKNSIDDIFIEISGNNNILSNKTNRNIFSKSAAKKKKNLLNNEVFLENSIEMNFFQYGKKLTKLIDDNSNRTSDVIYDKKKERSNIKKNKASPFLRTNDINYFPKNELSSKKEINLEDKMIFDLMKKELEENERNSKSIIKFERINPLKINLKGIILNRLICFCNSKKIIKKKYLLLKHAEKNYNYNLDIVTYLKKMNEIRLIEKIMFEDKNKILLDYIARPIIELKQENEEEKKSLKNECIDKKLLEKNLISYKIFKDLNQNKNFSNDAQINNSLLLQKYFEKENKFILDF